MVDHLAEALEHAGLGPFDHHSLLWSEPHREAWRSTCERSAALDLLLAADLRLAGAEPESALPRSWNDGLELVEAGDLDGALAFADELQAELEATPAAGEVDADLVHGSNIVRGWVHARRAELDQAAACLQLAGRVDGSAVLESFGPNLSLAWELLRAGKDEAALAYFHDIARFWTPRR